MSFDSIKVILEYWVFFNEIVKNKKKTPTVTVEQGTFGTVVGALPNELLGDILEMKYLINIKITISIAYI